MGNRGPALDNLDAGLLPSGAEDPENTIPDPFDLGGDTPFDVRVFISGKFRQEVTTPNGVVTFDSLILAQTRAETDSIFYSTPFADTEPEARLIDRPVASSLMHELVHVATAADDNTNPNEVVGPLDPGSVLNSSPTFSSLTVGNAQITACRMEVAVPVDDTEDLCIRALEGFICGPSPVFDFTD